MSRCAPYGLPLIYIGLMECSASGVNLACNILHLEDDDNDSLFFQRALARVNFIGAYRRVSDPPAVIKYLTGTGQFADRRLYPLPDILVIDGALAPAQSTADLFAWLNPREEFKALVKVALTGGVSPAAQSSLLGQGVVSVLAKGVNLVEFSNSVEEILRRCVR